MIEYGYLAYQFLKNKERELKTIKGLTNEESGGVFYYEKTWYGLIRIREFVEIENVRKIYDENTKSDMYLPDGIEYRKAVQSGIKGGYNIGDWHTHFGNVTPSGKDDETMMHKVKVDLSLISSAAMIIISETQSKLFIYKRYSIKTQIL